MAKDVKDKAAAYLADHALIKTVYSTSDGFLFETKQHAIQHGVTLEDKAVMTHLRQGVKMVKIEPEGKPEEKPEEKPEGKPEEKPEAKTEPEGKPEAKTAEESPEAKPEVKEAAPPKSATKKTKKK